MGGALSLALFINEILIYMNNLLQDNVTMVVEIFSVSGEIQ